MSNLGRRIEALEKAANVDGPASPSLVVVPADGRYRLPDGREMAQADFEREYPTGDVLRLVGFEGV